MILDNIVINKLLIRLQVIARLDTIVNLVQLLISQLEVSLPVEYVRKVNTVRLGLPSHFIVAQECIVQHQD